MESSPSCHWAVVSWGSALMGAGVLSPGGVGVGQRERGFESHGREVCFIKSGGGYSGQLGGEKELD